VVRIIIYYYKN